MAGELVSRTLEYHCVAGEQQCHCDWRLTLQNCIESYPMTVIYHINIAISALVFVIGACLLAHRVFIKGHQIFEVGNAKGCLRPKPIDAMLLLLSTYNLLRLLTSVILVSDIANDMISRSFMFEFPWQFGYGSFALYLVGIAQTLADSHKAISSGWLPSARTVDIGGSTFFLAPFVLNNICALLAGAYARSNLYVAEVLTRILYVLWFLHCGSLAMAVLFSGVRLVRILNRHLAKVQSSGPRYTSIKTGIFKIRAVMGCIVVCLMLFAIFLLLYGILRDQIMVNTPGSIFLGTIWNFLGPVTTLCVEIAIIFNPRIGNGSALGLKSSSGGPKTTTNDETMSSSYAGAVGIDNSFQATSISHHAFEDLKQQQLQYQQVFQKHNNRHYPANNSSNDLTANKTYSRNQIHMNDLSQKSTNNATQHDTKYPVWTTHADPESRVDDDFSSQIQLMNDR